MPKIYKFALMLVLLVLSLFILYKLINSRTFQFFDRIVYKLDTTEKVVALTFDDGPTPENTDRILKIMADENIKATFYLTGQEISSSMAFARKIVQAGHAIGNHTYSHKMMIFRSPQSIEKEITLTDNLIREAGYLGEISFRPPFCKKLLILPWYLHKTHRKTVTWSLEPDSKPELMHDPIKMTDYISKNIQPGSIILMHVMYKNREASIQALKPIIHNLKSKGYRFVSITS